MLGQVASFFISVKQMVASPLKNLVMCSADTRHYSPVLRLHETVFGKVSKHMGPLQVCLLCLKTLVHNF